MRWSHKISSIFTKLVTILYISVLSRSLLSSTWTKQFKSSHVRQRLPSSRIAGVFLIEGTGDAIPDSSISTYPLAKEGDIVDSFCRWTNSAFRNLTISPVRNYLEIIPAEANMTFFQKLKSPPQYPGISRPVSLTIAASVPTALGWYGYYKFSVEEELFQDELRREGRVTGCGGYGTLLPFVFLFLIGSVTHFVPAFENFSNSCIQIGGVWILLGQINLYRRVNELSVEKFGGEPPLYSWWALLPPPLDVVVGLRQVHFLAKYWAAVRGEVFHDDVFANTLFPFISADRFTLKEFFLQPRRWFWFSTEAKDFDV